MQDYIFSLAAAIVQPQEEEKPLLAALCAAAEAKLAGRLRDGLAPADCGNAFPCAAALLAAAGLLPCRSGGAVEQFTAGDVSIRTGGGLAAAAAAMERQAGALLEGYAADGGFAFLGVRG